MVDPRLTERFERQMAALVARQEREATSPDSAFRVAARAAVEQATADMDAAELRDLLATAIRLIRPL